MKNYTIEEKDKVRNFYDSTKDTFDGSYDYDGPLYPSNRIRMEHCLDKLATEQSHRVLDAGCGTGIILRELLAKGYNASGCDFSKQAIVHAKQRLIDRNQDSSRVCVSDLEGLPYPDSYFDATLIMGAFTHPLDHEKALAECYRVMRPGGLLLVELRNLLMGFFSLNEFTVSLFDNHLIHPDSALREVSKQWVEGQCVRRDPIVPETKQQVEHEHFFDIPSVWRNPLTVDAEYKATGFTVEDKLFFHWHAVPPAMEKIDPVRFRAESLVLERNPHDWRGHFMASAFILVARRGK